MGIEFISIWKFEINSISNKFIFFSKFTKNFLDKHLCHQLTFSKFKKKFSQKL